MPTPTHFERLHVSGLWAESKGQGVTIALLDSGVINNNKFPASRVACFDEMGKSCAVTDGHHGAYCAGLITSTRHGVAPAARLISYKVTYANGDVSAAHVVKATRLAIAAEADIVSCSFNIHDPLDSHQLVGAFDELTSRGVIVFGAASPHSSRPLFPYRAADVIVVGEDGSSNQAADLLLPARDLATFDREGRATTWALGGTSAATALAAGIGALLLSVVPVASRRGLNLRQILISTSKNRQMDPIAALAQIKTLLT